MAISYAVGDPGCVLRTVVTILALLGATTLGAACDDREPTPVADLPVGDGSCPDPEAPPARSGPDGVPLGAIAMRLCEGPRSPAQAAPEVLTTGLDSLADLVNGLPHNVARSCDDMGGLDYRLVFTYSGGRVQQVNGSLGGCGTFEIGGTSREGAELVLDEVTDRFREQRSGAEPATDLAEPPLVCPRILEEPPPSLLGSSTEMVRAVLCVSLDPNDPVVAARVPVSPDELRVLLDDLAAGVVGDDVCRGLDPRLLLLGSTAWGDVVTERLYCVGFQRTTRTGAYIALSPEGRAIVDRATRRGLAAGR